MKFKKLSFIPKYCPKILLPFWLICILIFYILYTPYYFIAWLFIPLCVIFPPVLKVVVKVLKVALNVVWILFKAIVWIPYAIFVLPFQAIDAKRKDYELKVWKPFKKK